MSYNSEGSGSSPSAETAANSATRHFILGLPKDGAHPESAESASLHAAETFVSEIQREIIAYDMANARAMEAYARGWWERVPFFGRRWAAAAAQREDLTKQTAVETNETMRGAFRVERTADLSDDALRRRRLNSWLFKQRYPGWVPLIQRGWIPWVCVLGVALVWTPDVWKLRTLYWCDHKYALLRREVHKAYWRVTMRPEDFNALMEDMELHRPISVKTTDCPL